MNESIKCFYVIYIIIFIFANSKYQYFNKSAYTALSPIKMFFFKCTFIYMYIHLEKKTNQKKNNSLLTFLQR